MRLLAALLLAANFAFLAWAQGWLAPALLPPMSSEREPERLAQQVRPEVIELLGPKAVAEARRAQAAASAPAVAPPLAASAAAAASAARPVGAPPNAGAASAPALR